MVAHPLDSGETRIAHAPVRQHAGDGREDAERLASSHRVSREEGGHHHIGTIGIDILMLLRGIGILCLHPVTELGNERTEVVEGAGSVIVGGIAYRCQRALQ